MKRNRDLFLLALIVITCLTAGCTYKSEDVLFGDKAPCDTSNVTYSVIITRILNNNGCLGCHVGAAPSGNFTLTSYQNVLVKVQDGTLWGALNHLPGFSPMPQGGNKINQ